jgi:hypothetical protein
MRGQARARGREHGEAELGLGRLAFAGQNGAVAREEKEKPFSLYFQMCSSSKPHFEPQKLIFKK